MLRSETRAIFGPGHRATFHYKTYGGECVCVCLVFLSNINDVIDT